jgi:hypothetical protein
MSFFVGAYWKERNESQHECAVRMAAFLEELARENIGLPQWYKKARSRKAPLVAIPKDVAGLEPLLRQNRRDIGSEVIPDLGFNFSAWAGPEDKMGVSLSATCGAYNPLITNSVVLSFSSFKEPLPQSSLDFLQEILRAMVSIFDSEDAVLNSSENLSKYSLPVTEAPAICRYKGRRLE